MNALVRGVPKRAPPIIHASCLELAARLLYIGLLNSQSGHPKHYCGVFGIYGHPNAADLTYYGLYALQHRGQESAGIVSCDNGQFHEHKRMGLVSQIFSAEVLPGLAGSMAIGHTRYSTTGSSHLRNAQPLTGDSKRGQIAIAHNGNLTNAAQLREELEESHGAVFTTSVDSEIILHLLAQPTIGGNENNLVQTVRRLEGAYSLVIMTESELIGVRDPFGFRPLCLGRAGDGLGAGQRNLRAGFDLRQIRAGRRAGGNRDY